MNWKKVLGNAIAGFLTAWAASNILLGATPIEKLVLGLANGTVAAFIAGLMELKAELDSENGYFIPGIKNMVLII